MFRGHATVALDAKGRMAIPAKYRGLLQEQCAGRLIVTIDIQPCLMLYPYPAWQPVEKKLMALPSTDPNVRGLQRVLVGNAEECQLDAQGRILLPAGLRERKDLGNKVILVGQGHRFEIWNEAVWQDGMDEWMEKHFQHPDALAEKVNIAF